MVPSRGCAATGVMTTGQTAAATRPEPTTCTAARVRCLAVPGDAIACLRRLVWPYRLPQLSGKAAKAGKPQLGGSSACSRQRHGCPSVPSACRGAWCGAASPLPLPGGVSWTGLIEWCAGKAGFFWAQVWCPTLRPRKWCVAGCCALACARLHPGQLQCPGRMRDVPGTCLRWSAAMAPCLWQLCRAARGLGAPSSGSCARLLHHAGQVSPGWAWLFPFSQRVGAECRAQRIARPSPSWGASRNSCTLQPEGQEPGLPREAKSQGSGMLQQALPAHLRLLRLCVPAWPRWLCLQRGAQHPSICSRQLGGVRAASGMGRQISPGEALVWKWGCIWAESGVCHRGALLCAGSWLWLRAAAASLPWLDQPASHRCDA